jgi:WD40 repeat protein
MAVGHESGAIAIWDLATNQLDRCIDEIHKSEVVCIKFLTHEKGTCTIVSAESKGPV